MNAKYCKLIRKIVRDWGYSPAIAKALRKDLVKAGVDTPSFEFLVAVMETVDRKMKENQELTPDT
jgi:hypothetical protein